MGVDRHQVSVEFSAGWSFVTLGFAAYLRFDLCHLPSSLWFGLLSWLFDLFLVVDDERSICGVLAVSGCFWHLGWHHS